MILPKESVLGHCSSNSNVHLGSSSDAGSDSVGLVGAWDAVWLPSSRARPMLLARRPHSKPQGPREPVVVTHCLPPKHPAPLLLVPDSGFPLGTTPSLLSVHLLWVKWSLMLRPEACDLGMLNPIPWPLWKGQGWSWDPASVSERPGWADTSSMKLSGAFLVF